MSRSCILQAPLLWTCLKKTPNALGTYYYLDLLRCVVDSYLDKQLSPLVRVKKCGMQCFFSDIGESILV